MISTISFYIHHQGGLSEGYKKYLAEKELPDDTYTEDGLALFRVQGTGPENMQAIQVEPVSSVLWFSCYSLWASYVGSESFLIILLSFVIFINLILQNISQFWLFSCFFCAEGFEKCISHILHSQLLVIRVSMINYFGVSPCLFYFLKFPFFCSFLKLARTPLFCIYLLYYIDDFIVVEIILQTAFVFEAAIKLS